jgi:hypothetical protein
VNSIFRSGPSWRKYGWCASWTGVTPDWRQHYMAVLRKLRHTRHSRRRFNTGHYTKCRLSSPYSKPASASDARLPNDFEHLCTEMMLVFLSSQRTYDSSYPQSVLTQGYVTCRSWWELGAVLRVLRKRVSRVFVDWNTA